jgi:hypothetical protein
MQGRCFSRRRELARTRGLLDARGLDAVGAFSLVGACLRVERDSSGVVRSMIELGTEFDAFADEVEKNEELDILSFFRRGRSAGSVLGFAQSATFGWW